MDQGIEGRAGCRWRRVPPRGPSTATAFCRSTIALGSSTANSPTLPGER